MVGYITTAHDIAQRLSEKWRHFVVHCLYSLFCTSPRCVGVPCCCCCGPRSWSRLGLFLRLRLGCHVLRRCYSDDATRDATSRHHITTTNYQLAQRGWALLLFCFISPLSHTVISRLSHGYLTVISRLPHGYLTAIARLPQLYLAAIIRLLSCGYPFYLGQQETKRPLSCTYTPCSSR